MRACNAAMAAALPLLSVWGVALAEPPSPSGLELKEDLLLGIAEHRLDAQTELTGWRLNRSWYLGHRDGDGKDALSLIWQGERRQVSISTEEIRFTRRF